VRIDDAEPDVVSRSWLKVENASGESGQHAIVVHGRRVNPVQRLAPQPGRGACIPLPDEHVGVVVGVTLNRKLQTEGGDGRPVENWWGESKNVRLGGKRDRHKPES